MRSRSSSGRSPAHHDTARLTGDDESPATPLRIRVLSPPGDGAAPPPVASLRNRIRDDLVADVTRLLGSGARLDDRTAASGGPRPVRACDVAVLVRKNDGAEDLRRRLVAAGVPAVVHGARSVFASETAAEWLILLTALEQPRQALVRRAALTCFFGWSAQQLAEASEGELVELSQQIRGWRRVLTERGVAALVEAMTVDRQVPDRLLAERGGARSLTDLRHVADLLHAVTTSRQLGVGALVEWLNERIEQARRDSGTEGSRRLETDADAVSIVTVHRSKGLEYPIVYLPDAADCWVPDDDGSVLALHRAGPAGPECVLDVGGRWAPGRAERYRRYLHEQGGEELRLLYVALTRAGSQVVTWWAASRNTPPSALHRFLHRRARGVPAASYPLSAGDPTTTPPLGVEVGVEPWTPRDPVPLRTDAVDETPLSVRTFARGLDLRWRRTSYSALTAAAHGVDLGGPGGVGSEPEPAKEDDETDTSAASSEALRSASPSTGGVPDHAADLGSGWDRASPMADLPSGTDFGTAVHEVFERVDPGAVDLAAAVLEGCRTTLARIGGAAFTADALAAALLPAYQTPLGPLARDRRICDVARRDQLAELSFELPLAGGDAPVGAELTLGALAPLLRAHLRPDDPLAPYAAQLSHPLLAEQSLRGYLTGSVDAVLRIVDPSGRPRYLVADYKTNWLGSFDGRPLTLRQYAPPALAAAMMGAHYPLQALLYSVAVHRMLRWRQPGYDPEVHLGGVLYLFVRGMSGAQTPKVDGVPAGVFSWLPPAALVTELSDLLSGAPRPDPSSVAS